MKEWAEATPGSRVTRQPRTAIEKTTTCRGRLDLDGLPVTGCADAARSTKNGGNL